MNWPDPALFRRLRAQVLTHARAGDLLILAVGLALIIGLWVRQSGSLEGRVQVRAQGKPFMEASLRLNREIRVPGPLGFTQVQIRDGRVRVAADPSPRQLCVRQGWIPPGGMAVCLPNQVSVENAATAYDSLNY